MLQMKKMIMAIDVLPWEAIETPTSNINLLRVLPEHPHNFFWGRDAAGCYLLVLKGREVELKEELLRRKIELSGIKVDIRHIPDTDETFLMLLLQETENADIFLSLCNDLIHKTKHIPEIRTAMEILFSRLQRWRIFLSRAYKNILSDRQIQGLFSELKFLEECMKKSSLPPTSAVEGWQGPLGGPHDFVLGQSAVEIKSVAGSQNNSILISSENQLQTHLQNLYLNVFILSKDPACATGMSLNGIVRRLRKKLTDKDLLDVFEERLFETGYIDIREYDTPCFSVSETQTYLVSEGFPRITPDLLPEGIMDVSYKISLRSIEEYGCDTSVLGSWK